MMLCWGTGALCLPKRRYPVQVTEPNLTSETALSTPVRVWGDDHLAAVVYIRIVNVQLQLLSFMRFDEGEQVFALFGGQKDQENENIDQNGSKVPRQSIRFSTIASHFAINVQYVTK